MFNGNNTGIVQCKTVKVATLDFFAQIVFSHSSCHHLMLAQGHKVSLSDCRWRRCALVIMLTDKEKAQCLVVTQPTWHSCVFSVKWNILCSFPLTRFSSVDAFSPAILVWKPCTSLPCLCVSEYVSNQFYVCSCLFSSTQVQYRRWVACTSEVGPERLQPVARACMWCERARSGK